MLRAATRTKPRFCSMNREKRFPFFKALAACLLLLGGLFLSGYLDFLSDSSKNPSLSGNISGSTMPRPGADASCVVQDATAVDPSEKRRPVEISDVTSDGDTLLSLLSISMSDEREAETVAAKLAATMRTALGKPFRTTDELISGVRYTICLDEKTSFQKATFELDPSNVFHCVKEGESLKCWKEDVVLDYKTEVLTIHVQKGIVQSVLAAHEGRELALKLVHIFRWDIDFQADSRPGDQCKIVFERRYADDRPNGYGRILFAVYDGKRTGRKTACLFNGEYYDESGVEIKKDYLRTPLNTLRITSGYGMRMHPVLHTPRFHNGVDYGAPVGTPVFAIASGTVTFQGCDNRGLGEGYGLYVCVRHDNGIESRYSHLSRILVKTGQRVNQRQTIGLVGSTGWSTGPHLFFEIIANGKRVDPTKVKMVKSPRAVPAPLHNRFKSIVNGQAHYFSEGTRVPPARRT